MCSDSWQVSLTGSAFFFFGGGGEGGMCGIFVSSPSFLPLSSVMIVKRIIWFLAKGYMFATGEPDPPDRLE